MNYLYSDCLSYNIIEKCWICFVGREFHKSLEWNGKSQRSASIHSVLCCPLRQLQPECIRYMFDILRRRYLIKISCIRLIINKKGTPNARQHHATARDCRATSNTQSSDRTWSGLCTEQQQCREHHANITKMLVLMRDIRAMRHVSFASSSSGHQHHHYPSRAKHVVHYCIVMCRHYSAVAACRTPHHIAQQQNTPRNESQARAREFDLQATTTTEITSIETCQI